MIPFQLIFCQDDLPNDFCAFLNLINLKIGKLGNVEKPERKILMDKRNISSSLGLRSH